MGHTLETTEVDFSILDKMQVSNGTLKRARHLRLALIALGNPAARDRHERLTLLDGAFVRAITARSAINLNDSNRRAQRLGKFVSMSADGIVAGVALTDPQLALNLPQKSSADSSYPVAYAVKVLPVLEQGAEEHQAMANVLRGAIDTFFAARKAHQQSQEDRAAAEVGAENARLELDAYVSDCLKFINDAAPRGHVAHELKKPKRKSKATQDAPAKTDEAQPESSAPAHGSGAIP